MVKKQKTRVTPIPTSKGISITLPVGLIDKLNQLSESGQGINISRAIRFILEDYFASVGDGSPFPEFKEKECLITLDLYSALMKMGKFAIKNQAAKGELRIVNFFDTDFVQLDENDMINYYAQVQLIRQEVARMKEELSEVKLYSEPINELYTELNKLKKTK